MKKKPECKMQPECMVNNENTKMDGKILTRQIRENFFNHTIESITSEIKNLHGSRDMHCTLTGESAVS